MQKSLCTCTCTRSIFDLVFRKWFSSRKKSRAVYIQSWYTAKCHLIEVFVSKWRSILCFRLWKFQQQMYKCRIMTVVKLGNKKPCIYTGNQALKLRMIHPNVHSRVMTMSFIAQHTIDKIFLMKGGCFCCTHCKQNCSAIW